MKRFATIVACIAAIFVLGGFDILKAPDGDVKSANKKADKGEFEEAFKLYDEAEARIGRSHILNYNRGVAHYKKGEYEKAREQFLGALGEGDAAFKADNYFNLGNSYFKLDKLDAAAMYYRKALKAAPDHAGARKNLEIAIRKMQEEEEKRKQEEEEKEKEKEEEKEKQEQENKEQCDKGQQENQGENKEEQKEEGKKEQEQEQRREEKGEEQKQEEQEQQKEEQQAAEAQPLDERGEEDKEETPKEDAEVMQLLDAMKNQEEFLQRERFMKKEGEGEGRRSKHDW